MSKKKWTVQHIVDNTIQNVDNKEATALLEFKARLRGKIRKNHDDYDLIKWLKARNFDVDKAEQMYLDSMLYREKMDIDTLVRTYQTPEVLKKYMPGGFSGFDKEGSPVLIELYGYTDMKGILYSAKKSDIEKTKLLLGEKVTDMLNKQTKKFGRQVTGMTVIIDLDNVGSSTFWGPGIQMYAHMGKILQDNYPEIVKRTFIVNAPRIFPMLWKMFRPLVTEDMKKKVCILGDNYKEELLQHIAGDQLPAFLGGTLTDPDGNKRCPSKICQGGTIPEKYYLKDTSTFEDFKNIEVPSSGTKEFKYNIKTPGTMLRWQFKTETHDIAFGIFYQCSGKAERQEVLSMSRVNSHWVPEDGTFCADKKGIYTIVFDNTYSWTKPKTVSYQIDLIEQTDDVSLVVDLDDVTKGGSWDAVSDRNETTYL